MYGIREICQSVLNIYADLSRKAGMHKHYILACLGTYLGTIVSDQGVEVLMGSGAHILPQMCQIKEIDVWSSLFLERIILVPKILLLQIS